MIPFSADGTIGLEEPKRKDLEETPRRGLVFWFLAAFVIRLFKEPRTFVESQALMGVVFTLGGTGPR